MLPAWIVAVIIIVVHSCQVVGNVHRMVVIERSALILGIEILEHHIAKPCAVRKIQFGTQHDVLQLITIVSVLLAVLPFLTLAITVVVEEKHLTVVLKEMIGINTDMPGVGLVVETHQPAAQMVSLHIGIGSISGISTTGYEGMKEILKALARRYLHHLAIGSTMIDIATKLGSHL